MLRVSPVASAVLALEQRLMVSQMSPGGRSLAVVGEQDARELGILVELHHVLVIVVSKPCNL